MAFHRTHNNLNMEGESPMKSPTKSFLLVVATSAAIGFAFTFEQRPAQAQGQAPFSFDLVPASAAIASCLPNAQAKITQRNRFPAIATGAESERGRDTAEASSALSAITETTAAATLGWTAVTTPTTTAKATTPRRRTPSQRAPPRAIVEPRGDGAVLISSLLLVEVSRSCRGW